MSTNEGQHQYPTNKVSNLMELAQAGIISRSLEEFATRILPTVSEIANSPLVLLYLADLRLSSRVLSPWD